MSFNVGNNNANFLSTASPVATYPFAVHLRARANSVSGASILWASQSSGNNAMLLTRDSDSSALSFWGTQGGSVFERAQTTNSLSIDTWFSALIVGISATERRVYLDGVGEGVNTTNCTIGTYTATRIARSSGSSDTLGFNSRTFDGLIGDVCFWKDFTGNPFTAEVRQALAMGISPLLLTAIIQNIVSYLPLFNDNQGLIGPDYTENGTVAWSPLHPTLYLPRSAMIVAAPPPPVAVADTILLTDSATYVASLTRDLNDTISLFETTGLTISYNRSVTDTIALTDSASRGAAGVDEIDLIESISLSHGRSVIDTIGVTEEINLGYGFSASDTIELTDEARRVIDVEDTVAMADDALKIFTATDIIALTETTFNSDQIYVTDTISLTDAAQAEPTPSDDIQLFETADYNWSGDRDADDDLVLFETISYVVNADCPECCDNDEDYHPFIGVTSDPDLPEPPAQEAPTLTPSHSVVLSYPFTGPTSTVTLRAPKFGNQESVSNSRIHRESRGGTLIIFADTQWPKIKRLKMEFSVLTEATAQEYFDFLATSLGQIIRLVDHESRTWQGVLIETDTPVVRNLRTCGVSASLTFEGELV